LLLAVVVAGRIALAAVVLVVLFITQLWRL
jgi:hypothetical protein